MNIPDNYDQWLSHEAQQERRLAELPVCADCDNHIQTESAYYINGEWICESCIEAYRQDVLPQ
jgi:formylmethanofuran dehydrogenase subunit E